MSDLIDRQAVLDLIEHYNSDGLGSVFYGYEEGVKFADAVNKLPPVNPQESSITWVTGSDGAKIAFKDVPAWKVIKICQILDDTQESEEV